ncbi:MAG: NAD(P)H-dependent oxidoreductase, partial [Candidatus Gracilibacteria bacterium]|nr:NAD(P)H-dependent oxidoreductase [Candidatus Gracilibacteria bacterium]
MKKTLIVTAHPSTQGFTHKIAEKYKLAKENKSEEAEIINLYDSEYQQPFLAFEDVKKWEQNDVRDLIQKKISESEELVFVFPIWWGQVPAIMKNFFDINFGANFAFKYEKGKPVGLLTNKTARVFATCDAAGWVYKLPGLPNMLAGYFKIYLLGFCGIKVKATHIFDHMHKKS